MKLAHSKDLSGSQTNLGAIAARIRQALKRGEYHRKCEIPISVPIPSRTKD